MNNFYENAIVIKVQKQEKSHLVLFLLEESGLEYHNIYGLRRNISLAAALQAGNLIKIGFCLQKKKKKIIDLKILNNFLNIRSNYVKISSLYNVLFSSYRLKNHFSTNFDNKLVYLLVAKTIFFLDICTGANNKIIELYFYYYLSYCLGYGIILQEIPNKINKTMLYDCNLSKLKQSSSKSYDILISSGLISLFGLFNELKFEQIERLRTIDDNLFEEGKTFFKNYYYYHLTYNIIATTDCS